MRSTLSKTTFRKFWRTNEMKIELERLKQASVLLIDHLQKSGYRCLDLNVDGYWEIPEKLRFEMYETPKDFTIGKISDDLDQIESVLAGEREPIAYALVWLASCLRAVGTRIP